MTRELSALRLPFRIVVTRWLESCRDAGYQITVYSTLRTNNEQAALYAQGRESLAVVNRARKQAHMRALGAARNRYTVTRAQPGYSYHNHGLALDYVPLREDSKPDWLYTPTDPADIYDETAQLAMDAHTMVRWGGAWRDYGHIEMRVPGMSIKQLANLNESAIDRLLITA